MNKRNASARLICVLLALCVMLGTVFMSSCAYDFYDMYVSGEGAQSTDTNAETSGGGVDAPVTSPVNKDESVETAEPGNKIENDVVISANENDASMAAAAGLRSSVSVYCSFSTTSGGTSFWNPNPSSQTYYTTGSGVIYSLEDNGSAFIITNQHVVYDSYSDTENGVSDKIFIYLYGLESEEYAIPATYVGGSANYDIAVLRVDKSEVLKKAIESSSAAPVRIADSDKVIPGQTAIAIGNPSSTEVNGISVTKGIVSVDSEYLSMSAIDNSGTVSFRVIRTDAPVNAGNSGGGLFNSKGELIGIVNAKISSSDIENIGYAIPSNVARAIADNIIDYCYGKSCETVMRGLLGITITVSGYSSSYNAESGVLERYETISVYEVTSGGLGESILKTDDIILSITIGDKTVIVNRQHHLIDAMLDVRVGDKVEILIERDGKQMTVGTTITEECLAAY